MSNEEINLDDKSLYKYVIELEQISNLIKDTPPKDPDSFGKMEHFSSESLFSSDLTKNLFWLFVVSLVVLIIMKVLKFNF